MLTAQDDRKPSLDALHRLLAEQRAEKQPRAGITARDMPTGTQLAVPATGNSDASVSDWVTG
jgi:hypothetical protein